MIDRNTALEQAAKAYETFCAARQAMNAARPDPIHATPAERALYDERYRADHEAEREHFRTAIELAQQARALITTPEADCDQCGRKPSEQDACRVCALAPEAAVHDATLKADHSGDVVERVARALWKADFDLQPAKLGHPIPATFDYESGWDELATMPLSGPGFVEYWTMLAGAALAAMPTATVREAALSDLLTEAMAIIGSDCRGCVQEFAKRARSALAQKGPTT